MTIHLHRGAVTQRRMGTLVVVELDPPADAGKIVAGCIIAFMQELEMPNGLSAIGYTRDDIGALVEGTLPQHRVTKLSPRPAGPEELSKLFEDAMVYW